VIKPTANCFNNYLGKITQNIKNFPSGETFVEKYRNRSKIITDGAVKE